MTAAAERSPGVNCVQLRRSLCDAVSRVFCSLAHHIQGIGPNSATGDWQLSLLRAIFCCGSGTLVVVLGVLFGAQFVPRWGQAAVSPKTTVGHFAHWDGRWQLEIAESGYSYGPSRRSNVAYFPAYPLLARWLARLSGISLEWALVLASNACFFGAAIVLARYFAERATHQLGSNVEGSAPPAAAAPDVVEYALLGVGMFPAGLFFRCAYGESLFLLLSAAAMYALWRKWPLVVPVAIVGLATATRPVGVALLAPLAIEIWRRSGSWRARVLRLALWLPAACWGLAAYSLFLHAAFDEPLAFVHAQEQWFVRPPISPAEEAVALLTLEPFRAVYDSESPAWWGRTDENPNPWFSLLFANPLFFALAIVLTLLGWRKRWLTAQELALVAGLLLVPYLTRAYDMGMGSFARFTSVAFPLYLVIGRLLAALPPAVAAVLVALAACLLGIYSVLFGSGHLVF